MLYTLNQLVNKAKNLRPAFAEIGEDLVNSIKRRFAMATVPDGTPWVPNSQVTIERYLGVFKGSRKKDGSSSKAGQASTASKKPLMGETKTLRSTINYQLDGAFSVGIGSSKIQAAMLQFGGTRAQFPHLWGDIPERPFLGVSTSDRQNILDIICSYLVE